MATAAEPGRLVQHASGRATYAVLDDFTDPWKDAETVFIQPGFGRHSRFFYHWIPLLAGRFRVVRHDLPGHGSSSATVSPSGDNPLTMDDMCEEIADTLDQLGLAKVHFLGESTSGILGLVFAAKYPDRLHSLTICATPTYLPPAALETFAFGHQDWPTACRTLGSRGWAQSLAGLSGTVNDGGDPAYLAWWIDMVAMSSGESLAQYAQFLSTADAREHLSDISIPVLILTPANSIAVSVQDQQALQKQVKGSRLVVINGLGHEIYKDEAEACTSALKSFIDKIGLARRWKM